MTVDISNFSKSEIDPIQIVGNASTALVSNEKVWLTDLSLSGGPADPTGLADSSAAIRAAITKAAAVTGSGHAVISGPPGTYKCLSNMYFPGGVCLSADVRGGGLKLNFPVDTGPPTIAFTSGIVSGGSTTISYTNIGLGATAAAFAPATPSNPQTVLVDNQVVTYTGISGSSLTGVSGLVNTAPASAPIVQGYACHFGSWYGGVPTVLSEGIVIQGPAAGSSTWRTATPPSSMDGVYLGSQVRCNGLVAGFRMATALTQDHQQWGGNFKANNCYAAIHFATPNTYGPGADQSIEQGAHLDGCWWSAIYLEASNAMATTRIAKAHMGFAPWGIWKASLTGGGTDYAYIDVNSQWDLISFEQVGIGAIGCADGGSALSGTRLTNCNTSYGAAYTPGGQNFGPVIVASTIAATIDGAHLFVTLPSTAAAFIQANTVSGDLGELGTAISICAAAGKPFATGYASASCNNIARFTNNGWAGRFTASGDSSITVNDVCGLRDTSVERLQRAGQAVAGVALLPPGSVVHVPLQLEGPVTVKVNASNDIPNAVGWVRGNSAAAGKAIAASSQLDAAGSVFGWRFAQGDNGTTCPCQIAFRLAG